MWGLLTAGANLLGNFLGYEGQKDTNRTNIQLGREQMDFQERMSNTAYQRATKDMQAAGLNPMLAYSQGGASAPVGSMPQVQNAASHLVGSAGQAVQVLQGIQNLAQTEAGTEKLRAETAQVKSLTLDQALHTAKLVADTRKVGADTDLSEQEHNRRIFANPIINEILDLDRAIKASSAKREAGTWEEDVKLRRAERELRELAIPEAKSQSQFFESVGQSQPFLRMVLEIIKAAQRR